MRSRSARSAWSASSSVRSNAATALSNVRFTTGSIPFLIILSLIAGLVVVEPDMGTAVIICAVAFSVFFVAGANLWHLIIGFVPGGIFTAMAVTYADIGQMVDEHESLLDALASGDPQRAAAEMRLHLEDARRRLTLVLGESAGAAADHPRPDGRGVATDRVAAPEVIAAGTIRSAQ